jgi:NAD(P)-dependent dehydrogenase (short-subunit alcohol dehydrogenase family)
MTQPIRAASSADGVVRAIPTRRSQFHLDAVVTLLRKTVFRSTFGLLILLILRARNVSFDQPKIRALIYYTAFRMIWTTLSWLFRSRQRINWSEQVVVVTGGTGGVGSALVKMAAQKGAKVASLDLNVIESNNPRVRYYKCDITNVEAISQVARAIRADLGEPTVLINNAGYVRQGSVMDVAPEYIERTFQVNSIAPILLTREFLPAMLKKNQGHIVTVASMLGWIGVAGLTTYCASKGAAVQYHDALQHELRILRSNIRTTVVCPGHIATPLFAFLDEANPFLLPVVYPEDIAGPIIKAIEEQRNGDVYVPCINNILPLIAMLPQRLRMFVKENTGFTRTVTSTLRK